MKTTSRGILLLALIWTVSAGAQEAKTTGQWEPFEIEMTAQAELTNAYVEGLPEGGKPYVQVTFAGTGGDARGMRYTVAGFWDGGHTWKARSARP